MMMLMVLIPTTNFIIHYTIRFFNEMKCGGSVRYPFAPLRQGEHWPCVRIDGDLRRSAACVSIDTISIWTV